MTGISSHEIYITLHCTTHDITSSNYSHAVFPQIMYWGTIFQNYFFQATYGIGFFKNFHLVIFYWIGF